MREQNEKIKQRRLVNRSCVHSSLFLPHTQFQDVAADEDAFKQTQVVERQRQAQMRKVQETVNRTREQSARRKMDKMQSREWDSDKKAERWQTAVNPQQPTTQSSASTTRTNSGDGDAEAETSPTVKPREERNRGRGSGRRGRGRGRGRGEVRDRAPPAGVPQAVEEEKAEGEARPND
jgi:hypothetical protein